MPRHGSGNGTSPEIVVVEVRDVVVVVVVEVSGGNWLKPAGPVARPGRNKMYANGLINYEISSVSYVSLLKGNTAGWSIPPTAPPLLLSLSYCLSFLVNVGQLWAANEAITTQQ